MPNLLPQPPVEISDTSRSPNYQWRRDMFRPQLAHLADVTALAHRAQGHRWVFAVDNRTVDLDR